MSETEELRRDNERLRAILASTRLGLWDWDMTTGTTVFDERWAEIVGYRLAELQPTTIRTWQRLANPEDLVGSDALIARHARGELPFYDIEVRMQHRDGHWVWVHDRGRIVERDADGRPVRMIGTHEDVTARVESARALAASQRLLTSMFRDHDAVMLLIDPASGRIVDANLAAAAYYGYPQQVLATMSITDLNVLPADQVARLWHDAQGRRRAYFVFPHRLASGEVRMVDVHSSPVEDGDRTLLFSIVRDVTQHLRSDLLELLTAVIEDVVAAPGRELDAAIDRVLRHALELFEVDRTFVFESAADAQTMVSTHECVAAGVTPEAGDPQRTAMDSLPFSMAELRAGGVLDLPTPDALPAQAAREREALQRRGARSLLVLPLTWRGRLAGFVGFESVHGVRRFTAEETAVMRLVAGVIAQSLDRRSAQQRLELADSVFRHSEEGMLVLDTDRRVIEANPAFTAITGYDRDDVVGQGPTGPATIWPGPVIPASAWQRVERGGTWLGKVWGSRRDGRRYLQRVSLCAVTGDAGHPESFLMTLSDITVVEEQEQRLDWLARFDPLTGLPNREEFAELLGGSWPILDSLAEAGALILLNVDRFQSINDSYGRETGDRVLATIASRLETWLGRDAVLARFGGDEFAVLATEVPEPDQAVTLAEDLLHIVSPPIALPGGIDVHPSCCAGVVALRGSGLSGIDAVRHADAALHLAKASGPGSIRVSTGELAERSRARMSLESRLRNAWDRRLLAVHYQPQVEVDSGRVVGAEALLRWTDSDGLPVSPVEFVPLAEETGLIGPIGLWVVEEACRLGVQLVRPGATQPVLAVNVSAVQLRDRHLVDRIADILARTGFPPYLLELELTESTMLEAGDFAEAQLMGLGELGLHLALDDFGTGYSSFGALRRLPLHQLKIDRCFIGDVEHDADARAIAAGIIALGQRLGLTVLAEGVETSAQLAFLRSEGCDLFQGFLASPAVCADAFGRLLRAGPIVAPRALLPTAVGAP